MIIFDWLLAILSALLTIPVVVICVEIIAAVLLSPRKSSNGLFSRPTVAVLIPAHNEGGGLLPTITDVQSQLVNQDRLLVVADNCTDDTAFVARKAGCEVVERNEPDRVGKGFALDRGVRYLAQDPPEIVIVVDADCRVGTGSIDELARACARTSRPMQSLNLMVQSESSEINHRVAEFAWRVKNWVRPLGLLHLSLPCQLMGTGMAFPWSVIRSADLASGEVVEDLRLGLDLAAIGKAPFFCPAARVTSIFPSSVVASTAQRERWEGGHLKLIRSLGPRMVVSALARRNFELLALVLDLLVPPLTVMAMLLVADLLLAVGALLSLSLSWPLIVSIGNLLAFGAALILAWHSFGRELLSGNLSLFTKFLWEKGRLYRRMSLRGSSARWVRAERDRSSKEN